MTGRPILVAFAVCLFASTLAAQEVKEEIFTRGVIGGTINAGINQWTITGASATDGILTDFNVPLGADHQFSTWWWYRVAGDTAETIMPPPDAESYDLDTATLTWSNVDGRGLFDALLQVFIIDASPGALLLQGLTLTSISGANLDLQVFAYSDMDMSGSSGNDSASLAAGPPTRIDLVDIQTGRVIGNYPDGYRVDAFPNVRNALNDTLIDNFANTGLPFGPGDYTGAFQWRWVLASGRSKGFTTLTCVIASNCDLGGPVFADGFETGNTVNWDATVP